MDLQESAIEVFPYPVRGARTEEPELAEDAAAAPLERCFAHSQLMSTREMFVSFNFPAVSSYISTLQRLRGVPVAF